MTKAKKQAQRAMKSLIKTPVYETTINKAVFSNQDILIFPRDVRVPDNILDAIKFLFGEGVYLEPGVVNMSSCLIIKGASFILSGAKTINANWTLKEVPE